MTAAARYPITLRPLTEWEGGGFLALAPYLPGCMSDGETPADALANVYDAIECWIEGAEELSHRVPEPSLPAKSA